MVELVPSFILKADRAEKHLNDLRTAINDWADTHPYEVSTTHYRKGDKHHLRFTTNPPIEVGLIATDFVHNLRSGLDHLMAALVPSSQRDSVYFPIFFQGVWELPVPGENAQMTKDRGRWKSYTAKVRPEAVAILKALQPAEEWLPKGRRHAFKMLNELANVDRHQRLPVTFSALRDVRMRWIDSHGQTHRGAENFPESSIAKDGAELGIPPDAMQVKIAGSPLVAIEAGPGDIGADIRESFAEMLVAYRERVVQPLAPYVHRGRHGL